MLSLWLPLKRSVAQCFKSLWTLDILLIKLYEFKLESLFHDEHSETIFFTFLCWCISFVLIMSFQRWISINVLTTVSSWIWWRTLSKCFFYLLSRPWKSKLIWQFKMSLSIYSSISNSDWPSEISENDDFEFSLLKKSTLCTVLILYNGSEIDFISFSPLLVFIYAFSSIYFSISW